jgi:hypothetical protein
MRQYSGNGPLVVNINSGERGGRIPRRRSLSSVGIWMPTSDSAAGRLQEAEQVPSCASAACPCNAPIQIVLVRQGPALPPHGAWSISRWTRKVPCSSTPSTAGSCGRSDGVKDARRPDDRCPSAHDRRARAVADTLHSARARTPTSDPAAQAQFAALASTAHRNRTPTQSPSVVKTCTEASAVVIPECDPEFGCCVHQAEEGVTTVAAIVAWGRASPAPTPRHGSTS